MAPRSKKTTKKQFEELIDFVESHKILIAGAKNKPQDEKTVQELWEIFSTRIIGADMKPVKSAKQWKKVWLEWKVNTRRKQRQLEDNAQTSKRCLNDLEMRLLNLICSNGGNGYDKSPGCGKEDFSQNLSLTSQVSIDMIEPECDLDIKPVSLNEALLYNDHEENLDGRDGEVRHFCGGRQRNGILNALNNNLCERQDGIISLELSKALGKLAESIRVLANASRLKAEADVAKARAELVKFEAQTTEARHILMNAKGNYHRAFGNSAGVD